jgi:hypothetical protein
MTGGSGIVVSLLIPVIAWVMFRLEAGNSSPFVFDPKGKEGTFETILEVYIRAAEVIVGLAAGSIVLLVGALAWHGTSPIPWKFAAPLFVFSVHYHLWDSLHGVPHSRL